jgi:A/G-specific adenine glycosylase
MAKKRVASAAASAKTALGAKTATKSSARIAAAAAAAAAVKRARSAASDASSADDASYAVESEAEVEAEADASDADDAASKRGAKRRRLVTSLKRAENDALFARLFGSGGDAPVPTDATCGRPPLRQHAVTYHRPLMLHSQEGRKHRSSLLAWFDSVSTSRAMPWRKPWVNPHRHHGDGPSLRAVLERRAYEVWISEIMLQQTASR